MKDFSWANGTVEQTAAMLANARVKQADGPSAVDMATTQAAKEKADLITDGVMQSSVGDALKWGLGGLAVGGLGGIGASLTMPAKRRRMASDAMTGALIGGIGGAGLGLAQRHLGGGAPNKGELNPDGSKKVTPTEATLATKVLEGVKRRNDLRYDEGERAGFLPSRFRDYGKSIPNAIEAVYERGLTHGLPEAGKHLDVLGLRHLNSTEVGDPITGKYGRGGIVGFGTGRFHSDLLLAQMGLDAGTSAFRKTRLYKDPEYLIKAINAGVGGSGDPAIDAAIKAQLGKMKESEIVDLLKSNYGGFQIKHNLKPDALKSLMGVSPDQAELAKRLKPDQNTLNTQLKSLRDSQLKKFTDAEAAHLAGNPQGTKLVDKGNLVNPFGQNIDHAAYAKALAQVDPSLATKYQSMVAGKVAPAPEDISRAMYEYARRHGGNRSIAALDAIAAQTALPSEFQRLQAGGKGEYAPAVTGYSYKPQGGNKGITDDRPTPITMEDVRGLATPQASEVLQMRLNLEQAASKATAGSLEAEALTHLSKQPDSVISQAIAKANSGQPWTHEGRTVPPQHLQRLYRSGQQLTEAENKANFGFLRRAPGGPGPKRYGYIYDTGARGAVQALGRGATGLMAKTPRWAFYGAPLAIQEFQHFRGNRENIFGRNAYQNQFDNDQAILNTPEYFPVLNTDFHNQANELARLIGPDYQNMPAKENITPKQKLEVINTLRDQNTGDYVKSLTLRRILGFKN